LHLGAGLEAVVRHGQTNDVAHRFDLERDAGVLLLARLVGGEGPGDDEAMGRDALQTFSGVVAMYVT
jgi:hypothetical protein